MYINREMADMRFMYGLAGCNSEEARRLYENRFPGRRIPNKKTFQRLDERLRNHRTFQKRTSNGGRSAHVRTVNCEERILHHVEDNNGISTRRIAAMVNVSHVTVWRVLRE